MKTITRKPKPEQSNDVVDCCYTIINCFLDGKLDGLERSDGLNPILREALQKIAALKLALTVVCEVCDRLDESSDELLTSTWVQQQCLKRVQDTWRNDGKAL
jgi:hypothetical protein